MIGQIEGVGVVDSSRRNQMEEEEEEEEEEEVIRRCSLSDVLFVRLIVGRCIVLRVLF